MNGIDIDWFFTYIDSFPENSPSGIALVNMFVAWKKHLEEEDDERTDTNGFREKLITQILQAVNSP